MIHINKEYWNDIPVLIVEEGEHINKPLPVLTFIHGFTSAKEHNLPLAYLLAGKGYRVILPDCHLHGEREGDITTEKRQMEFFEIIKQNVIEIEQIKQKLDEKDLIKDGRFGLAGTSMGGMTTAAAITQYPWIKTAGILMGTPKLTTYMKRLIEELKRRGLTDSISEKELNSILEESSKLDLSLQPEVLAGRPLFFWHGEEDPVVPFDHSYSFHESVISLYKNPENIRFLREVGRGHKVSRFATIETVDWFELQL
ncbi:esterase [Paraliobacillus sp. PM-2]|uniref:alpha/beta fold hydrolase n=1 Tax=Paraliobacillus sp. PM-2 TaxID=1462524 RepID=UPI00061CCCFF|nr:alpha/beta fold hydrolase [Paraliobacillus sp. PM-2]CQR46999.1 esterase [Paraliobacillus sp. PM-2]